MANQRKLIYGILAVLVIVNVLLCGCNGPNPPKKINCNCNLQGSHGLFVAKFDSDTVGDPPAPTTPLHYGPPGASLNQQGNVEVVDSTALGSKAVRLKRSGGSDTIIEAVVGDIGEAPYTSGLVYIVFRAHGEITPKYFIAGVAISVLSAESNIAFSMKLYDGAYYLREGDSYVRLTGTYDTSTAHSLHITMDLDINKFCMCIDDEVVVADKAFQDEDFTNLHSLKFLDLQTITEAFDSIYVVDDIRITI